MFNFLKRHKHNWEFIEKASENSYRIALSGSWYIRVYDIYKCSDCGEVKMELIFEDEGYCFLQEHIDEFKKRWSSLCYEFPEMISLRKAKIKYSQFL